TDNVRIGDSDKIEFTDNWELSTARALRVTRFLIEQGLDPKQLAAAGYGPHDPLRSNRNKRGRKLNRRIELILEPKLPDFRKLARLSRQAEQAARAAGKPDGGEDSADSDPNGGTEGAGKDDDSKK
ncbi:MAG: OmpA family protein, partial [Myxococcota bacterium]